MQELQFSFIIFALVLFIAWYIRWNSKKSHKPKKQHTFKKTSFRETAKKQTSETIEERIRRRLNTKYN